MMMSRLKWLSIPLSLAVGAAGGMVLNQQIMLRSADLKAKQELAVAAPRPPEAVPPGSDAPPAEAMPLVPDAPPQPGLPRSPFDMGDGPAVPGNQAPERLAVEANEQPPKVEPPLVVRNGQVELDPPPGYFDLPAPHNNDGTDPPIIKPGQILQVEVLEALPGRPITGERVVRPDGTISLGFYGDLRVAGLNRDQIKVKLIQHLRQHLVDEVLGLVAMTRGYSWFPVKPVQSNRVFVDDSLNYAQGRNVRPTVRGESLSFMDEIKSGRINVLEGKIHRVVKELEDLRAEIKSPKPGDTSVLPPTAPESLKKVEEEVKQRNFKIQLKELEDKLYAVLKELEDLKKGAIPAAPDPVPPANPTDATPSPASAAKQPG